MLNKKNSLLVKLYSSTYDMRYFCKLVKIYSGENFNFLQNLIVQFISYDLFKWNVYGQFLIFYAFILFGFSENDQPILFDTCDGESKPALTHSNSRAMKVGASAIFSSDLSQSCISYSLQAIFVPADAGK